MFIHRQRLVSIRLLLPNTKCNQTFLRIHEGENAGTLSGGQQANRKSTRFSTEVIQPIPEREIVPQFFCELVMAFAPRLRLAVSLSGCWHR